eukprot:6177926-Pleurochrysis_carterae.AAC.1
MFTQANSARGPAVAATREPDGGEASATGAGMRAEAQLMVRNAPRGLKKKIRQRAHPRPWTTVRREGSHSHGRRGNRVGQARKGIMLVGRRMTTVGGQKSGGVGGLPERVLPEVASQRGPLGHAERATLIAVGSQASHLPPDNGEKFGMAPKVCADFEQLHLDGSQDASHHFGTM